MADDRHWRQHPSRVNRSNKMGQVQWRAEVWFSPRLTYRSKCPPHLAPLNPSKCLSIILFFGLPSKDMGGHRAVTTSSVRHCGNTLSKPNEGPYSWLISLRGVSNVPVWRINALKLDLSHFCLVTSSIQSTPLLWAPSRHWHEPDVR